MGRPPQSRSIDDRHVIEPGPRRDIGPRNDYIPFSDVAVRGSIPDRFEQQVALNPHRIAIKSLRQAYTFDEVNRAANRVAHALLGCTTGGGNPVALFLEHGESSVMAILGVLKSGNMYVPIDTGLPSKRISYMLQDSGAALAITNCKNRSAVQKLMTADMTIIDMDGLDGEMSETNPDLRIKGEALASIIYTSGSTGQPKGVLSAHSNLLQALRSRTNIQQICMDDRIAFLSSYSTGMSRADMFGALLNGATLFPFDITPFHPKEEGLGNLAGWLIRERITILPTVPTIFRHFVETLSDKEKFPHIRLVSLGGEALYPRDLESFKRYFPDDCLLMVHFGMSETCSVVASLFIDKRTDFDGDMVPVGYPYDGFGIFILDDQGKEVEAGQVGEIVVKSRHLSPGYWRRPELTEQRFLPCPEEEGLRMYHTGDLGVMNPNGCLYHLGRKDFQVKVRGHRVETGEIEKMLLAMKEISQAAVIAHPQTQGENRLIAYISWNRGHKSPVSGLRAHLRNVLPGYMIPSDFIVLDTLPLTPSGKIDRQSLPLPDFSHPEREMPLVAPKTPTEKELADLWSEILQVSPVGIDDDFFDLGGNSLSAARLFARINSRFGKNLPVSTLFKAPTIEALAAILNDEEKTERGSLIVPIHEGGLKPPLFFVHTLTGDVVAYAELARHLDPDRPFFGIRAQGLDRKQKPHRNIEAMASHYIAEIRTIQPEGPYLLGGMCFGGAVAFEMARQLNSMDQGVGLLILIDTPCPPFTWNHALLFQGRRYLWHLRQDMSGLARSITGSSSRVKHRSFTNLLLNLRTTIRILRVDRANHRALRRYHPRPYPGKTIHFLRSQSDTTHSRNIRLRWDLYIENGIDLHTIPGDHHTMLREPNVRILAEIMNTYLATPQP